MCFSPTSVRDAGKKTHFSQKSIGEIILCEPIVFLYVPTLYVSTLYHFAQTRTAAGPGRLAQASQGIRSIQRVHETRWT